MSSSVRTNGQGLMPRTRRQHRQQRVVQAAVTVAAAMGLAATSASRAADVHWNVPDGNWETPANWAPLPGDPPPPPAVPGTADRAILDFATGGTAHVTTDLAADPLSISIKSGNVLSVESGGVASTGTTGTTALDTIRIGDGGAGSAVVLDGGTLRNNTTGGLGSDLYVGVEAGGLGTLTQSGATSLVHARDLRIGSETGTGSFTMTGGTATTNWVILGRTGGTGSLTLDGGTILAKNTAGARLQMGDGNNSTGVLNFLSGTIETTGQVNIGAANAGGNGTATVTHDGGTLTTVNSVHIGRDANGANLGTGTYTLGADANSTASIVVNSTTSGTTTTGGELYVGYNGGQGTMTINGGTITTARGISVGNGSANSGTTLAQGTLVQHGGTVTSGNNLTVGGSSGQGTYNIDGTAHLIVGDSTNEDLVVGGANADTNGYMTASGNAVIDVKRHLRIGNNGGQGTLTQNGGDINLGTHAIVGDGGGGGGSPGRGTLILTAGTFDLGQDLVVGDAANTNGTLTISGTAAVTAGDELAIGRSTTLGAVGTQSGGSVTANSLKIGQNTGALGSYALSGGTLTVQSTVNNRTLDITGGTASLGAVSGTGAITVGGTGTVNAQHLRQPSLAMTGGTVAIAASGGAATGTSVIPTLALSGPAKFDLNDGKLITNNPVGTATTPSGNTRLYDGLQGLVQKAKNGDAWDGAGLTSSKAATEGGLTTIGIANGAQAKGGIGESETALWGGQTITGSSILAMYTYAGDANLDGAITGDDYSAIDFGILFEGMDGYANGDFNYDGYVTGDDYSVIDLNILLQGPQIPTGGAVASASAASLSGVTAVPEPSACGFALLGAAMALRRRRRCTT